MKDELREIEIKLIDDALKMCSEDLEESNDYIFMLEDLNAGRRLSRRNCVEQLKHYL